MSVFLCRRSGAGLWRLHSARHIFSVTGVWEPELDNSVRLEVEKHWLDKCSASTGHQFTEAAAVEGATMDHDRRKYVLAMFPYPSGKLHMGHVRVYSISDALARFYRLRGKQVLQPIGWDAFGLPAENAAVSRGLSPATWTRDNVAQMRQQLRRLCLSLDWQCELNTSQPQYYRWTQWLFVQLFRARMVYQKHASVNWDPVDETVLADEQVDGTGRSWRSGALVQRRLLKQWFIRTTRLASRLRSTLDDPAVVQGWRDVALLQRHWLGDCHGWKLDLQVVDEHNCRLNSDLTVWLADLRQLRHATCVIVQSQHPLLHHSVSSPTLSSATAADQDAPLSPRLVENMSVCVPCGGAAEKFRQVPLLVLDPPSPRPDSDHCTVSVYPAGMSVAVVVDGVGVSGRDIEEAVSRLCRDGHVTEQQQQQQQHQMTRDSDFSCIESDDKLGVVLEACRCSSHLHDWLVSRQRYWGTPIPVVHCRLCGPVSVPEHQLPVELPDVNGCQATDSADNVNKSGKIDLKQFTDWINTKCPRCGGDAARETDTLDTFVDSSWYYLRYLDASNCSAAFNADSVNKSLPVSVYIGGKEHATLHLYYARFMHHFLHMSGLLKSEEPFTRLLSQGQLMARTFTLADTGQYVPAHLVDSSGKNAVMKDGGAKVRVNWEKMSKSKQNGVDPDSLLDKYGADTTRLFVLANVSPTSERRWSDETFEAQMAWQRRLWLLVGQFVRVMSSSSSSVESRDLQADEQQNLRDFRHQVVRSVSFSFQETFGISTGIVRLQALTKQLRRVSPECYAGSGEFQRCLGELLVMVAPVMPCLAAEMWSAFSQHADRLLLTRSASDTCSTVNFNWEGGVHEQSWPEVDHDGSVFFRVQLGSLMEEFTLPRQQLDKLTVETAVQLARRLASADGLSERLAKLREDDEQWQLELAVGLGAVLKLQKSSPQHQQDDETGDALHKAAVIARDRKQRINMRKERRKRHSE